MTRPARYGRQIATDPKSGTHDAFPGDDLVADPALVFDRSLELGAPPDRIWPWLVQLGKDRSGWYLPYRVEEAIPARRRAARVIVDRWQSLAVGERVPDYGPDRYLEVAALDPPRALVYRSERGRAHFSWALLLEPLSERRTCVHLRFRGRIESTGWKRAALVRGGDFFDWATSELMLRGLRDRVQAAGAPADDPSVQ